MCTKSVPQRDDMNGGERLGRITVKKDGQTFELDDNMTSKEAKQALGIQPGDVLVDSRGKQIRGNIKGQVSDGENMASYPQMKAW